MKTENTVQETIKVERRKLFWRLYSLPWVISTVLLSVILIGGIWVLQNIKSISLEHQIEERLSGIEYGKKQTYQEAVDIGYGKWAVNNIGIVDFQWIQSIPKASKKLIKVEKVEEKVEKVEKVEVIERKQPFTRKYPFTWSDYKMGQSIGLDLERSLIISVGKVIDGFMTNGILCNEKVEEAIRNEFNGFETYHKSFEIKF